MKCLNKYKETLKSNVPKINFLYDGYLKNYSGKDGSLLKKIDDKELTEV